ncbi:MAG: hypothetical protein SPF74_05820 [Candidatus Limivicinus sp.]|nr:hypothetical protein [Candidatus Limivicinus sp.]
MPPITYPNQRMIRVHRERVSSDFLGIKNENWQAAARDLGAHAFLLYLYCAANKDDFTLALSPTAIRQGVGMARSTYHDQFHKLIDKGYLVPAHGNTFDFYEIPKSATQSKNTMSDNGYDFENCTSAEHEKPQNGFNVLPEDIEINNSNFSNSSINTGLNIVLKQPEDKPEEKRFVF